MTEQQVRNATRASVNDTANAITKGALIAICIISFLGAPFVGLAVCGALAAVFLPFYLALSANEPAHRIGIFILKAEFASLWFAACVWGIPHLIH